PFNAAVWSCALCAFCVLLRVGAATTPTQRSFVAELHASRAHGEDKVAAGRSVLVLALPRTKTFSSGAVVTLSCATVQAWRVHLVLVLSPSPDAAHLFSSRVLGRLVPLSRSVLSPHSSLPACPRLTRLPAGDPPILKGHYLGIGGCTALLRVEATFEDFKGSERWRPDA
ncbi:hypothetical protein V8E36_000633, partial [Tilletia maclaganii]